MKSREGNPTGKFVSLRSLAFVRRLDWVCRRTCWERTEQRKREGIKVGVLGRRREVW